MCTNDDDAHPQYDRDMNNVGLPSPSQYSPEALSQQFRYVVSIPVWMFIHSFPVLCGKVSSYTENDIHCTVSLGELFLTFWRMMVPLSSRVSSLEDEGSLILQNISNSSPSDTGWDPRRLDSSATPLWEPSHMFPSITKFFITLLLLVCYIHNSECSVIICGKYRCLMCL